MRRCVCACWCTERVLGSTHGRVVLPHWVLDSSRVVCSAHQREKLSVEFLGYSWWCIPPHGLTARALSSISELKFTKCLPVREAGCNSHCLMRKTAGLEPCPPSFSCKPSTVPSSPPFWRIWEDGGTNSLHLPKLSVTSVPGDSSRTPSRAHSRWFCGVGTWLSSHRDKDPRCDSRGYSFASFSLLQIMDSFVISISVKPVSSS